MGIFPGASLYRMLVETHVLSASARCLNISSGSTEATSPKGHHGVGSRRLERPFKAWPVSITNHVLPGTSKPRRFVYARLGHGSHGHN